MRPISLILLLFFTMASATLQAQSWSVGIAGIYGDDIKNGGLHVRGYYNVKGDRICFGPEFSRFIKTTETHNGETFERQLNEVNLNLHYVFELNHHWGLYPLTGLNISSENEVETTTKKEHSLTKVGANLGLGVHRAIGQWILFGEYDHLFSTLSQNSILLGAFFTFGKKTETTNTHE
ncbi:MAG: hypothetical protein ACI93L_001784 [Cyclobacteriaceae bacterium]|jgi:hypothetical protein